MTSTPEWPNQGGVPSQQGPFNNPAWQPIQPTQPMQALQPIGQPAGAQLWGLPQAGSGGYIGPGGPTGYIGPVSVGNSYGGRRFPSGMSFAGGSATSKVVGLVFALVGIGAAVLGVVAMHSAKIPKSFSASASGTIVALNMSYTQSHTNGTTSQSCDPIASFQVGAQHLSAKLPGFVRSACNSYQGETVVVRYDPNQPGHADIATGSRSGSTSGIVFIIFGVGFAAIGLLCTFGSRFGFVRIGTRTRAY